MLQNEAKIRPSLHISLNFLKDGPVTKLLREMCKEGLFLQHTHEVTLTVSTLIIREIPEGLRPETIGLSNAGHSPPEDFLIGPQVGLIDHQQKSLIY